MEIFQDMLNKFDLFDIIVLLELIKLVGLNPSFTEKKKEKSINLFKSKRKVTLLFKGIIPVSTLNTNLKHFLEGRN